MPNRREVLRGGAALPAALAAATLIPEALRAQAFPARTITIVAPFPPGGVADYAARPLAAFLGTKFGKNVVVENRPGAGGGVGHAYVARAEPDGHTIMCSLPSLAVIPEANRLQGRPVNYEMTDFVPLARLFADPVLLVVKKEASWRSIQELVEDIKSNPGQHPLRFVRRVRHRASGAGNVPERGRSADAARAISGRRAGRERHPVGPGAGHSDRGLERQGSARRRPPAPVGAVRRQADDGVSRSADMPGHRLGGGHLHSMERRLRSREDAGASAGDVAERDQGVHERPGGARSIPQGWHRARLPRRPGLREIPLEADTARLVAVARKIKLSS